MSISKLAAVGSGGIVGFMLGLLGSGRESWSRLLQAICIYLFAK